MTEFAFQTVPEIICKDGAAADLASLLSERFACKSVFIVTDPGIMALGLASPMVSGLKEAGYQVSLFTDVSADPPEVTILDAAEKAKSSDAGIIIGFGGGSSMDVAKLVAALMACRQNLTEMYGVGNITCGRLPLVQIPTTAGTGSEVTNISVVTTGKSSKTGVISPVLYADIAVLDASLTLGLPAHITAATGIDAMVHAIEAYTSAILKNTLSDGLALRALRLLGDNIIKACEQPADLGARRAMMTGAMLAGQAFANAPVAAVHAFAYPIGGIFHVPHGLSNSLVLPHVLRFNAEVAAPLYAEIATHLGLSGNSDKTLCAAFIEWIEEIIAATGIERRMRDVGVGAGDINRMAADVMAMGRLLQHNPRELTESDARKIYEAAW